MAQNQRIRLGMARSSSRAREREILKIAKRLEKDPTIVLPECTPECEKNPFAKIERHLLRIKEAAGSEETMKTLARKGDPLARAVAATIALKYAGKIPLLAVFKTPFGEASYAIRGKTTKEKLVGVQNLDHPVWRLFAVLDIVKKRKVYVYSSKKGMVCTGRAPHPPDDFVEWDIRHLPYSLGRHGRVLVCRHLKAEEVKEDKVSGLAYLSVHWKSANLTIGVCENCVSGENTPALLSRYMAGPKLADDFEVKTSYQPVCAVENCELCEGEAPPSNQNIRDYLKGKLSDKDLVERGKHAFQSHVKESNREIYIAGGRCFGDNMDAFIDSLKPDELERAALKAVLEAYEGPVITDFTTPNKVLSLFWEEHGRKALMEITGDPELAGELMREYDSSRSTISSLLHEASHLTQVHAVLSSLPEYGEMPSDWEFADGVARAYRTGGKSEAIRAVEKGKDASKALAWAFLLALNAAEGKDWMFTRIEKDLGQALREIALELLNVPPAEYHSVLSRLLSAAGSSSEVKPVKSSPD